MFASAPATDHGSEILAVYRRRVLILRLAGDLAMASLAVYAIALHLRKRRLEKALLGVVQVMAGLLIARRYDPPLLAIAAFAWLVVVGRFAHDVCDHDLTTNRSP